MPYDVGNAFRRIEEELISSMIRNLDHHRAQEDEEGIQWTQWQVEQLRALDDYRRANKKKFSKQFSGINKKIPQLILQARQQGQMDQEEEVLEAIKKGANIRKSSGSGDIAGEFFKVNDRKLNALIEATTNDFARAEHAMLRQAEDEYRHIIFDAEVYANAGGTTYEKAVDMATKDFLSKGINCIEYKDGSRHRIEDYARMAIKTATTRAYLTGEGEVRKEWGIATVIVNKRNGACPKCAPFCGKVFIDDVWSGGSADGRSSTTGLTYPLISSAIDAGLYHPNCKDIHTTYFEGVSTPPDDKYSRDELDQLADDYRKEQRRQHAERQAEKYDRLSRYSLDQENQEMYGRKADKLNRVFRGARFKTGDETAEAYVERVIHSGNVKNVTGEWLYNSKPNSHEITYIDRIEHNGVEYVVDGKNVLLDTKEKEIKTANYLREIFGGEISFLPRIVNPSGIQCADIQFRGEKYDIKNIEGSGKHVLYGAVKDKKKQARMFVLDIENSKLQNEDAIYQVTDDIFRSTHTKFVKRIILLNGSDLLGVYERI